MANTLKFGNGEWYGKKDTILAYNDENNNYKPLPFDFSRGGSATVVNKDGLIETVGSGEPRIDYKDDSKGALLLEPSRTNLFSYGITMQNWFGIDGVSFITNNAVSPDGTQNATKITYNGTFNGRFEEPITTSNGTVYTFSVWLKNIDILDPTQVYLGFSGSSQIEQTPITNEWKRYSVTFVADGTTEYPRINSNSTGSLLAYGSQFEASDYMTSLIPTQGGVVTRLADECDNGGNEQVFNDSEGVLYAEVKGFEEIPTFNQYITISSPTVSFTNAVILQFRNNGDLRFYFGGSAGENIQFIDANIDFTENNKIAVQYDSNGSNYKMFVNGVSISRYVLATNQSVNGLSELNLNYGTSRFLGEVKDIRVYNNALTDQELIALTTI